MLLVKDRKGGPVDILCIDSGIRVKVGDLSIQ